MLFPKKRKYRREFRGKMKGKSLRGSSLSFGDYGLKALGNCWLTGRQIEAARKAITHHTKRGGKLWIRVFPDKPISAKTSGMRMGRGKGPVDHYAAVVRAGRVIFELSGVEKQMANEALDLAARKLPVATKIITSDQ